MVGKHPQNLEQTQSLQFQITPRVPVVLTPWILSQQEAWSSSLSAKNEIKNKRETMAKSALLKACRRHSNTNNKLGNNKEQSGGEELQAESRIDKHRV